MFKTVKRWVFWYKRSRQARKEIRRQIDLCKKMGPAEPPTLEQVEAFKKDFDMGWDTHMVEKVATRRTYFEKYITDPKGIHLQVWAK